MSIKHQSYYPNLVTLLPTASLNGQQDSIAELLMSKRGYVVSAKDSFAVLDLSSFGFYQLFQAQWILRWAHPAHPHQGTPDLKWNRVSSEKELVKWEEAWSQGTSSSNHLFLPALLDNTDICIMAAYKENQIVAGAIANRTLVVVGLSNVFTPQVDAERYWEGFLNMISAHYPTLPIVGYEQDEGLALALHVGFTILGPLRVWIKEAL